MAEQRFKAKVWSRAETQHNDGARTVYVLRMPQ